MHSKVLNVSPWCFRPWREKHSLALSFAPVGRRGKVGRKKMLWLEFSRRAIKWFGDRAFISDVANFCQERNWIISQGNSRDSWKVELTVKFIWTQKYLKSLHGFSRCTLTNKLVIDLLICMIYRVFCTKIILNSTFHRFFWCSLVCILYITSCTYGLKYLRYFLKNHIAYLNAYFWCINSSFQ